jgi:hypothetical protein
VLVGLVSYYVGQAAADAIDHYGLWAGAGLLIVLVILAGVVHLWKRRVLRAETES